MNYKINVSYSPSGRFDVTIVGTDLKPNKVRVLRSFEKCRKQAIQLTSDLECSDENARAIKRHLKSLSKKEATRAFHDRKEREKADKSREMTVAGENI